MNDSAVLLTVNKILTWHNDEAEEKWDERVLHIFPETGDVMVIDVQASDAQPFIRSIAELEEEIERGNATLLEGDPHAPRHFIQEELDSKKLQKFKKRRDKALKVIELLFTDENAIRMLFPEDRAKLIHARHEEIRSWPKEDRASERTVYKY
jgi:hypothetical protein